MARLTLIAFLLCTCAAEATWKPQYAQLPQAVQDWYQNAELTQSAQQVFPFKKCCQQAETVRTQFRVSKSNGEDEWFWLDPQDNVYKRIPDFIIHWNESGPNGEAVLFKYGADLTCFFPPSPGG